MTCGQIDRRVDAIPLDAWSKSDLDAAEWHARECDRCRAALTEARTLAAALTALPRPRTPEGLAAATMARIARLDDRTAAARDAAVRAASRAGTRAWLRVLAGQTCGLATLAYLALVSGSVPNVTASRLGAGIDGVVAFPDAAPVALLLAAGLTLYLAGFFAPLGDGGKETARRRA